MPGRNESFAELLLKSLWWVTAILGVILFILMFLAPGICRAHGNVIFSPTSAMEISRMSPLALVFFGLLAGGSFWFGKRRRLHDEQMSLQPLQEMSWNELLDLVAEMFRREGNEVSAMSAGSAESAKSTGAEGAKVDGVDMVLRKDGRMSVVQCRHWKHLPVGEPIVREIFESMAAKKADEVVIVTTGRFSSEAHSFASGKPIRLIDGRTLLTEMGDG